MERSGSYWESVYLVLWTWFWDCGCCGFWDFGYLDLLLCCLIWLRCCKPWLICLELESVQSNFHALKIGLLRFGMCVLIWFIEIKHVFMMFIWWFGVVKCVNMWEIEWREYGSAFGLVWIVLDVLVCGLTWYLVCLTVFCEVERCLVRFDLLETFDSDLLF